MISRFEHKPLTYDHGSRNFCNQTTRNPLYKKFMLYFRSVQLQAQNCHISAPMPVTLDILCNYYYNQRHFLLILAMMTRVMIISKELCYDIMTQYDSLSLFVRNAIFSRCSNRSCYLSKMLFNFERNNAAKNRS